MKKEDVRLTVENEVLAISGERKIEKEETGKKTPSATLQALLGYGVAMPKRSYRHRSAEDRETLSLGLAHGHSLRTMATVLGRAPSTVSRESARNTPQGRP